MAATGTRFVYAYLHGMLSGPQSKKGIDLAEYFLQHKKHLFRPNLNHPNSVPLSPTAALEFIRGWFHEQKTQVLKRESTSDSTQIADVKLRLVGSSYGGYLAARYAQLYSDDVDSLVLLCPAFKFARCLRNVLGARRWEEFQRGQVEMATRLRPPGAPLTDNGWYPVMVPYSMVEGTTHPAFPLVRCPTRIIHGEKDTVVPVEGSHEYAELCRKAYSDGGSTAPVTLDVVGDAHDLVLPSTIARIRSTATELWRIDGDTPAVAQL